MAFQRDVNPLSGSYLNFYSYFAGTFATFLTVNGWTIHVNTGTSNSTILFIASKGTVAFMIDGNNNNLAYMYMGTSWDGATSLNDISPRTTLNLAGYGTVTNRDLVLINVATELHMITVNNTLNYSQYSWFNLGELEKCGTYTGGLFLRSANTNTYLNYVSPHTTIMTGLIGWSGVSPALWSGGSARLWGVDYSTTFDVSRTMYSNTLGIQPNLSITIMPMLALLRQSSAITNYNPLGYFQLMHQTSFNGVYEAGDIITYAGHQYWLMHSSNAMHGDLAFRID